MYKLKLVGEFTWYLYWIGFAIGLLWEVPMSIADDFGIYPPVTYITPAPFLIPISTIIIMITASLWDGGLFLLGLLFVKIICKKPHFDGFNWKELGVLLIYGQVSELIVELVSSTSSGWEYNVYWWNPRLFIFNGCNITLMPQLIWLAAPILFYFVLIKLMLRFSNIQSI